MIEQKNGNYSYVKLTKRTYLIDSLVQKFFNEHRSYVVKPSFIKNKNNIFDGKVGIVKQI